MSGNNFRKFISAAAPLVDGTACARYAAMASKRLEQRLAKEAAEKK